MNRITQALVVLAVGAALLGGHGLTRPAPSQPSEPSLLEWASGLPIHDENRLVALVAVQVAAFALDAVVESAGGGSTSVELPTAARNRPAGRPAQAARPLMPFYSFASAATRTRES